MRILIPVLLILNLVACGKDKDEDPPNYDDLEADLEANRDLWHAKMPSSYSYDLEKSCFCGMPQYTVTVIDGIIAKVETPDFSAGKDGTTKREVAKDSDVDILSLDEMFDKAHEWAGLRPDHLAVEYDRNFHFPSRVAVDHQDMMADDETAYIVAQFYLPLPPEPAE